MPRGLRPVVWAWLAAVAILVQTVVPDFAMAARDAAQSRAALYAALGICHYDPQVEQAVDVPHKPAPASPVNDQRGDRCPFCMALGAHALAADLIIELPVPGRFDIAELPIPPGLRPPTLFLTSLHTRAPPLSGQA